MLLKTDPVGAFVDYPPIAVAAAATGPLAGLTMAVKDLYDVAGYKTGCGHPAIRAASPTATKSAPMVQALLDAGAQFVGKTHTDEIAFSLNGQNMHYGTPTNPAAPTRIPGGSSSGSASATAAGLADFALGTDTGGSVRAPASYCGLIGLRPTHGRLPLDGVMKLAPSFDVAGWFARDISVFAKVGKVLMEDDGPALRAGRLGIIADAFALLPAAVKEALAPALDKISARFGTVGEVTLTEDGLEEWFKVFGTFQGYEIAGVHGEWVRRDKPELGPGVAERVAVALRITAGEGAAAGAAMAQIGAQIAQVFERFDVLVLPTVPGPAPLLSASHADIETFRDAARRILAISGLSGLPQLTLPLASIEDAPLGLSLLGPANSEPGLIELAKAILADG
ncbi:MAG: amidase [Alphaproteobacteria bacterium]